MNRRSIASIAAELEQASGKGDVSTRSQRTAKPNAAAEEDSAYRAAYGVKGRAPYGHPLRAAFYTELPGSPRGAHLTIDDAKRYLAHVRRVREMDAWTPSERERLRQIERKWERRAAGLDARYNAMGTAAGMNERFRPKSGRDILTNIRRAIAESAAKTKSRGPGVTFVRDPAWPMGKPTFGR